MCQGKYCLIAESISEEVHYNFLQALTSLASHFEILILLKMEQEAILLDLLRVVSHHGARLATPIRTVQKIYSPADLENVPFSDTIYSRSKGTTNRPYLLIEPSYQVNGTANRSRQNERKEAQSEAPSADNSKAASPDSKTDDLVTATSKSKSEVGSKNSEDFVPSQETPDSVNGDSSPKLKSTGNAGKEATSVDFKDTSPIEETSKLLSSSQSKQNGASSTHAFEENMVLGVALDGSKRTLPIEEDMPSPPEPKEMAAQNSRASSALGKDTKDSAP